MANPKRASMREGPLAALFRKTEGEDGEPTVASESAPAPTPEAATPAAAATPHPRESGLPHPALRASSDTADAGRAPRTAFPRRASVCATPSPRRSPRT